jgi:cell division protein ZapA
MPQVIVRVNDRPYSMMCDEGEEDHVAELAAYLDAEVVSLKKTLGQAGDSRLLLMAGLVVADRLSEALRKIETLQEEIDGLKDARSAAVDRTRSIEDALAEKLETAAARIEGLSSEINAACK